VHLYLCLNAWRSFQIEKIKKILQEPVSVGSGDTYVVRP